MFSSRIGIHQYNLELKKLSDIVSLASEGAMNRMLGALGGAKPDKVMLSILSDTEILFSMQRKQTVFFPRSLSIFAVWSMDISHDEIV